MALAEDFEESKRILDRMLLTEHQLVSLLSLCNERIVNILDRLTRHYTWHNKQKHEARAFFADMINRAHFLQERFEVLGKLVRKDFLFGKELRRWESEVEHWFSKAPEGLRGTKFDVDAVSASLRHAVERMDDAEKVNDALAKLLKDAIRHLNTMFSEFDRGSETAFAAYRNPDTGAADCDFVAKQLSELLDILFTQFEAKSKLLDRLTLAEKTELVHTLEELVDMAREYRQSARAQS